MQKKNTLDNLLDKLANCKDQDYVQIAKSLELDVDDFKDFQFFNSKHYSRNCIIRTEKYELILLCWEAQQITPIHCHGGEECWVYILEGEMEEGRYKEDENQELQRFKLSQVKAHDITYMNDYIGFHDLKNIGNSRAMSLHLYAKPILKCNAYDPINKEFIPRKMTDYSYKGKKLS